MVVGGGESGNFAVVKLSGTTPLAAEVDAPLDVDLRSRVSRRVKPLVQNLQLGNEIVNSISIHKLEHPEEPGVLDDVVAVLTNNDHSCRIFSLTQGRETAVLEHPFPVNHATISPDGQMLVVVGDDPQAFFYERVNIRPSDTKASTSKYASNLCQWEELSLVPLHALPSSSMTCYFATAWSPSGHLCAVASEFGYITVFDVDRLKNSAYVEEGEEAIVAVIPSTRPDTIPGPGAVRSLLFSPSPWDLLIWAEDQGRVCVADLRSSLRVRQVLQLDPDDPGLQKMEIAATISLLNAEVPDMDIFRNAEYDRRSRNSYDYSVNMILPELASNSEMILERQHELLRQQREQISQQSARIASVLSGEDDPYQSLGAQERQILESLRTRASMESTRSSTPRSIHYSPSELSGERRTGSSSSNIFATDFPALARSMAASAGNLSAWRGSSRANDVVREYLRERNLESDRERERDRDRYLYSPRRPTSALERTEAHESATARSSVAPRHPPLPPHLRPQTSSPMSLSSERAEGIRPGRVSPPPPANELNPEINEIRRRRQLARAQERALSLRERQLSRYEANMLMSRRRMNGQPDPQHGPQTAGLAMGSDGRVLWAAGECGIWEFEIDLFARKCFAAIEMR